MIDKIKVTTTGYDPAQGNQVNDPTLGVPANSGKLLIPGNAIVGVLYTGLTEVAAPDPDFGYRGYRFERLIAPAAVLQLLLSQLASRLVPSLTLEPADGTPPLRLDLPTLATRDAMIQAGDLLIVEQVMLIAIPSAPAPVAAVEAAALLALAATLGTSGAIEAEEAAGQNALVRGDQIPVDLRRCTEADLTTLGFTLGPVVTGDPLFRHATLPTGWTKRATNHALWTDLVDAQGRTRFVVMYKAASYDRKAAMHIRTRYRVAPYEDGSMASRYAACVKDGDTVLTTLGEYERDDYDASRFLEKKGEAWLDAHHPDWRNPMACWE